MDESKEIACFEKQIKVVERQIRENTERLEYFSNQLQTAIDQLRDIEGTQRHTRIMRQSYLADGRDVEDLNRQMKRLTEGIELQEDTIAGIQTNLKRLQDEKVTLQKEYEELIRKVYSKRLFQLIDEYNRLAEPLGKVVDEIWKIKLKLNIRQHDPYVKNSSPYGGWHGALNLIPKLYKAGAVPDNPKPFFDWKHM